MTTCQSDDVPDSPGSHKHVPGSPKHVPDSPGSHKHVPGSPYGDDTSFYYIIVPIMLIMAGDMFTCIFR